jgi:hypothetical protein
VGDFYRIMNQKRDQIEHYLDHDLKAQVVQAIATNSNLSEVSKSSRSE